MSRFVSGDTVVLKISNGDTLIVKRRLNSGEQRAAYARMYIAGVDGTLKVNPLQIAVALVTAYLVDWSLTDDSGAIVKIRDQSIEAVTSALDSLDPESFAEIRHAIEAHEAAMIAEREQEKKDRDGRLSEPATLPSPSGVAGALSGSVN